MTRRRLALTSGLLVCALAGSGTAVAQAPDSPGAGPRHSSDGVRGPIAPDVPAHLRGRSTRSAPSSFEVAPGVTYSSWTQTDARGPVRGHLLTVEYDRRGVRLDYANPGKVSKTAPVSSMVSDRAVAAVNADFFDIGDTGAPLGMGKDRSRGFLHAPRDGWNSAFYVGPGGRPQIGTLPVVARVKQHPRWQLTNVNSPSVPSDGIGVYTPRWGRTSGAAVTDGQTRKVRQVLVRGNRVVDVRRKLSSGERIRGTLLIGRDQGASRLASLRVGDRLAVRWRIPERPRMAITGNRFLVQDGLMSVVDDREMHPRTAVGISRDTREILLLVIDGRQADSRGYTMVELARLMIDLGADEALNLDGGGSSTMLARRPDGKRRVMNTPSDGAPRHVANALEVIAR
ncbi:phosphodiester glycosidase family protein [Nocardioides dongkuii]|uniref:phosphodiester glycosidase family protein n=1 Tax=Nocardioides dongkuii TaxID=2760089 RepID=UPI001878A961|nr:phosphodiester glycosidase family protein [Nocardioides dongkuii]